MSWSEQDLRFTAEPHPGTGKLRKAQPLEELLHTLDRRHAADKRAEARVNIFGQLTALGGLLSTGFIAAGEFFGSTEAAAIGPFVLAGTAASFGYLVWVLRTDINDRKLDAVRGLLFSMRAELDAVTPIEVEIDFEAYDKVEPDPEAEGGEALHVKPWLSLALKLADGARLTLSAHTLVRRRREERRLKRPDGSDSSASYQARHDEISERLEVRVDPAPGHTESMAAAVRRAAPPLELEAVEVEESGVCFRFFAGPATRDFHQGADPTHPDRVEWVAEGLDRLLNGRIVTEAVRAALDATRGAEPGDDGGAHVSVSGGPCRGQRTGERRRRPAPTSGAAAASRSRAAR